MNNLVYVNMGYYCRNFMSDAKYSEILLTQNFSCTTFGCRTKYKTVDIGIKFHKRSNNIIITYRTRCPYYPQECTQKLWEF